MRHTFACGVKLNGIREIRSISNMRRLSPTDPWAVAHGTRPRRARGPVEQARTPEREMTARTVQALASAG